MPNGIVQSITYTAGGGTIGYIRCGFAAGSATPATNWRIDGGAWKVVPAALGAYVATTKAGHTVTFSTVSPYTPPGATSIDLAGNQKATILIHY